MGGRLSGGGCTVEGASIGETTADGKDDAHRHGRGEDCSHGCNDCLDGIRCVIRSGDEPEEHIGHVDDPDSPVEVEAIAEHEFPWGDLLDGEGCVRAGEREEEGGAVEDGGEEPVGAHSLAGVEFGSCDTALSRVRGRGGELERHWAVEPTGDGHSDNLRYEKGRHTVFDNHVIWINGANTDDVDE